MYVSVSLLFLHQPQLDGSSHMSLVLLFQVFPCHSCLFVVRLRGFVKHIETARISINLNQYNNY